MRLKVMSFNVRFATADDGPNSWPYRRESQFEMIRESGCDLIGLQEVLAPQLEEIVSAAPIYQWVGVGREDGVTGGEFSAILYDAHRVAPVSSGTFWFSESPEAPGSSSWGNRCTRICTYGRFSIDGFVFDHYNLHIDHESELGRSMSIRLLLSRLHGRNDSVPTIVTGDFNAGEISEPVRLMCGSGFVDSFRVAYPLVPEPATYHGWRDEPVGDKIDYVFVDNGFKVLDAGLDRRKPFGRFPSDHYPVTAILEFEGARSCE